MLWLLPLALIAALLLQPFRPACASARLPRQPLTYDFAAGFYPPERDGQRRWRWMKSWGELRLCNHGEMVKDARLALELASFAGPRTLRLTLPGREPMALNVATDVRSFLLPPMDIAPGVSSVILQATPGAAMPETRDRRALAIALFGSPRIEDNPRPAGGAMMTTP